MTEKTEWDILPRMKTWGIKMNHSIYPMPSGAVKGPQSVEELEEENEEEVEDKLKAGHTVRLVTGEGPLMVIAAISVSGRIATVWWSEESSRFETSEFFKPCLTYEEA